MPNLLGHAPIAGDARPVYIDSADNQFVLGCHGERVYGPWLDVEDLGSSRVEGDPHVDPTRSYPHGNRSTLRC